MSKVLFSGQVIDEEQDLGYGPGHYLRPEQVKELYGEISKLSLEELRSRFNPAKMDGLNIYPTGWSRNPDLIDYLLQHYETLRQVYEEASANNAVIITFLN